MHQDDGVQVTHGLITSEKVLPLWELESKLNLVLPSLHFYKYVVTEDNLKRVYSLREQ